VSTGSRIEWTEVTWNPTVGCAKVSPGCDNCYAIRTAARFQGSPAYAGTVHRGQSGLDWTGTVNSLPDRLDAPLHWREPRRIFVNSMSDLFHDDVSDGFIARVFAVMSLAEQHTFQVLTKRHGRMRSLLNSTAFAKEVGEHRWPLPNVWLGVSVENQQWADIRIPALLDTPAAVRWISAEPLLGPVDLTPFVMHQCDCDGPAHAKQSEYGPALDWVVVGGESGPGARPMHPDWARHLRDQCAAAKVPYFFKQWGEWAPDGHWGAGRPRERQMYVKPILPRPERMHEFEGYSISRVGKKAAGRELDGRTWDEYPQAVPAVTG
jgi:protein gp37